MFACPVVLILALFVLYSQSLITSSHCIVAGARNKSVVSNIICTVRQRDLCILLLNVSFFTQFYAYFETAVAAFTHLQCRLLSVIFTHSVRVFIVEHIYLRTPDSDCNRWHFLLQHLTLFLRSCSFVLLPYSSWLSDSMVHSTRYFFVLWWTVRVRSFHACIQFIHEHKNRTAACELLVFDSFGRLVVWTLNTWISVIHSVHCACSILLYCKYCLV